MADAAAALLADAVLVPVAVEVAVLDGAAPFDELALGIAAEAVEVLVPVDVLVPVLVEVPVAVDVAVAVEVAEAVDVVDGAALAEAL